MLVCAGSCAYDPVEVGLSVSAVAEVCVEEA